MVVERSRASYLIGILGMLKVEGSNPGHPETFFRFGMPAKNELIRDLLYIVANWVNSIFGI